MTQGQQAGEQEEWGSDWCPARYSAWRCSKLPDHEGRHEWRVDGRSWNDSEAYVTWAIYARDHAAARAGREALELIRSLTGPNVLSARDHESEMGLLVIELNQIAAEALESTALDAINQGRAE